MPAFRQFSEATSEKYDSLATIHHSRAVFYFLFGIRQEHAQHAAARGLACCGDEWQVVSGRLFPPKSFSADSAPPIKSILLRSSDLIPTM